jgi:uncharacterized protein YjlB
MKLETWHAPPGDEIPNHPSFPVLLYRGVNAPDVRALFAEHGGPQGQAFEVSAGDVIVLPAGTGHRRATDRNGFQVCGAYPAGQEDYDLLRAADDAARARIAALPAPEQDPVGGEGVAAWR